MRRWGHADGDPLAPIVEFTAAAHGGAPHIASQLAEVRALTARFNDFQAAQDAGWNLQVTGCRANPPVGAMGFHYANPAFIDGTVAALEPEVVIYEPMKNGRMRFVGVEYIVPYAILPESASPPELFGEQFLQNSGDQVWMMHVWLGRHNPDGMLATWNPRVSCQYAS